MSQRPAVSRKTVQRANRVRFLSKRRLLRQSGASVRRAPGPYFKFMLGNELHTFSYQISNEAELAGALSRPLGLHSDEIEKLFDEGRRSVRELWGRARGPVTELTGRRLAWYAIIRELKPALVVESGADRGRGSVVILAALEANRREGSEGRLVSIDPQVGAGFLVPEHARTNWSMLRESSTVALATVLANDTIDIYIQDSLEGLGLEELRAALPLTADRFAFISAWDTPEVRAELIESGADVVQFTEVAVHPVFPGSDVLFGFLTRSGGGLSVDTGEDQPPRRDAHD